MSIRSTLSKTPARRQSTGKSPAKGSGTSTAKQQAASPATSKAPSKGKTTGKGTGSKGGKTPASLTAHALLQHYEKIADAPDAIPRLRRFVLDLAVRGKLVEQDPQDEPAEVLLQRIAEEKRRLVEAGIIKAKKHIATEVNCKIKSGLPKGWELSNLGAISIKITDGTHRTPNYTSNGVPFISVKDFSAGTLSLDNTRFISLSEHESLIQRCDPRRGDILIGRIGTLGKAVIVDTDVEFSIFVSVGLIRFDHKSLNPYYFKYLLNSPFVDDEFNRIKIGGGTHTNKLNLGDLHSVAIPLPPLAEQQRIVAKVDELMALLDGWEQRRSRISETRTRFTTATLARLTAPETSPAEARQHAQFALKHFPTLTTHPSQIPALRQTILNLAVRGKLVPQDPNDEPAAELLKRIAEEKRRLVEAGDKGLIEGLPESATKEQPFAIPNEWCSITLRDVLIKLQTGPFGSSLHQSDYRVGGTPVINPASIQDQRIVPMEKMAVAPETVTRLSTFKLRVGDIIMARRGEMGRCAIVNDQEEGWLCGTGSLILRPSQKIYLQFLALVIGSPFSREYLGGSAVGSTMQNLNQRILLDLPFGLPPLPEQERIVAQVDQLMTLCDQLEGKLITTTAKTNDLLHSAHNHALPA